MEQTGESIRAGRSSEAFVVMELDGSGLDGWIESQATHDTRYTVKSHFPFRVLSSPSDFSLRNFFDST